MELAVDEEVRPHLVDLHSEISFHLMGRPLRYEFVLVPETFSDLVFPTAHRYFLSIAPRPS